MNSLTPNNFIFWAGCILIQNAVLVFLAKRLLFTIIRNADFTRLANTNSLLFMHLDLVFFVM